MRYILTVALTLAAAPANALEDPPPAAHPEDSLASDRIRNPLIRNDEWFNGMMRCILDHLGDVDSSADRNIMVGVYGTLHAPKEHRSEFLWWFDRSDE